MKSSDELFLLIKSLKKTEKRYFKLFAKDDARGEEFNYMKLFEIIDKQQTFDEEKIINEFSKKKNVKHFAGEKKHLYGLILKSLNKYHSSISKENELNEQLNSAEILYKKGFYKQSNKLLDKLILFAYKHELFTGLIKIGELKIELISQIAASSTEMKEEFDQIKQHSAFAMEQMRIENEYKNLHTIFLEKIRENGEILRHPSEIELFKELMTHPLLLNENAATTIKSKSIYYFIQGTFFHISGDSEKAFFYSQKGIEHLEVQNNRTFIEASVYSARIANICEICLKKRDYKNLHIYIGKLKNCTAHFPMEQSKLFYRYNDLLIRYYVLSADFKKAIYLYNAIEPEIKFHKKNIHQSRVISIYYYLSYAYIAMGNYKNALIWLNKLLSEKSDYRKDLLGFSRILYCIIQYETGNYDTQESSFRAAKYYLTKQNQIYSFEELFLKYYPKLQNEFNATEKLKWLMAFKNDLSTLSSRPNESDFIEYFDIDSWLVSKLENRPFSEIAKSKSTM